MNKEADTTSPLIDQKSEPINTQPWTVYGTELNSRFFIGSALYPSPEIMQQAIRASGSEVITLSSSKI